ncbi:hypothetical protein F5X99DRAFT_414556 [Biscogniauxia marginata]|nr:hypothetical protein F5X99DRAFT_414556 [Biscogniauxia marginata]
MSRTVGCLYFVTNVICHVSADYGSKSMILSFGTGDRIYLQPSRASANRNIRQSALTIIVKRRAPRQAIRPSPSTIYPLSLSDGGISISPTSFFSWPAKIACPTVQVAVACHPIDVQAVSREVCNLYDCAIGKLDPVGSEAAIWHLCWLRRVLGDPPLPARMMDGPHGSSFTTQRIPQGGRLTLGQHIETQ